MFVQPGSPPLAPWLDDGKSLDVLHELDPSERAGNGDIGIDVAGVDPDSDSGLDENGVEPVAGIIVHLVVVSHGVAADIVLGEIDMEVILYGGLIEEVHDSNQITAGLEVIRDVVASLEEFGYGSEGDFLVVAGLVDVVDDCFGLIEFLVLDASKSLAFCGVVAESAGTSDAGVIIINNVGMVVEVLVLVNGHAILAI